LKFYPPMYGLFMVGLYDENEELIYSGKRADVLSYLLSPLFRKAVRGASLDNSNQFIRWLLNLVDVAEELSEHEEVQKLNHIDLLDHAVATKEVGLLVSKPSKNVNGVGARFQANDLKRGTYIELEAFVGFPRFKYATFKVLLDGSRVAGVDAKADSEKERELAKKVVLRVLSKVDVKAVENSTKAFVEGYKLLLLSMSYLKLVSG